MKFFTKIFDQERKKMEQFKKVADQVMALDEDMQKLSDEELKNKTVEFRKRLEEGETLEDIKVEAFAVVREAAVRAIGEKPFYVQVLGGLAIHDGNIAEMKTGEGKTLTCTMPAYLNALEGKGVHIVTVNEYLVGVAAEWMGKIYDLLGMTVGTNYREYTPSEKRGAYECDITYSTNNEIGFDYLRDNMVVRADDRVQRPFNFAIIDEVDSILIDEARTPLIISGGAMQTANLYIQADRFSKTLRENNGYIYDEKTKAVTLDKEGVAAAEKTFGLSNLYDLNNTNLVHYINQALRANFAMKIDVDYVIDNGKIVIIDSFTGRLMHGRAFSDGLHQAIEAKEGVEIQQETRTLATITFQNLFRQYKKLAGMTGTAKTEEEEFRDIYNMYVIQIPTNKPVVRQDFEDLIFATQKGKFKAIVAEIKERHNLGQPILVGTIAVETSELLSNMLKKEGIKHEVLNAKNHARESEMIKAAGQKGAVTIATNMAGRGADIKLGEGVRELGGLAVIGTERHESRRIDNQLRGRSGRQGDPGFSQFCVSFEDELMIRFGADRAKKLLASVGFDEDMSIRNKMLANSLESAQKRVEGNNFDTRKTLLQFDDVINQQREIIYEKRNAILDSESITDRIKETFQNYISDLVNARLINESKLSDLDISEILEATNTKLLKKQINAKELDSKNPNEIIDYIYEKVVTEYEERTGMFPEEVKNEFEKAVTLKIIDTYWMEHINTLSVLKEGIFLRSYAQENPLRAYTSEGFQLFDEMVYNIDKETTLFMMNAEIRQNIERKPVEKGQAVEDSSKLNKKQPKIVSKIGRNDSCPCGSGKKYKQCCGK